MIYAVKLVKLPTTFRPFLIIIVFLVIADLVTKLGCRKGAQAWASAAVAQSGRTDQIGASQSAGLLNHQI